MDEEKKTQGEEIPGKAEAEGPAAEDRRTTDTPDVQTDAPQTAQTNAAPEDESEDDEGGEGRHGASGDSIANELLPVSLETEMRQSYLDYAMSVIVGRALPDVRDGLKPVHRRVLYAMKEIGNVWSSPTKKAARVVGEVLGKFHPHGDSAAYQTIVRMAQDFSMRYPLIQGQGNFGSIDGDNAAAMRYTEVRLMKIASEMLADLNEETVDFVPNFDNSEQEPVVLPTRLPELLVNGSSGIAVGMATNIPPHNLKETIDACLHALEHPDCTIDELIQRMPAPDFPTGGMIDVSRYNDGLRGGVVKVRAKISKIDKRTLAITEIPYTTTTESIKESIIKANEKGKIKIRRVDDNTAEHVEIIVQVAPDESSDKTIDALYAFTDCEVSISPNACVIRDEKPHFMGVSEILRRSADHTRALLGQELEIRLHELNEAWHAASLERIFIENKLYQLIEGCKTREAAYEAVDEGLAPFKKLLRREVTLDDVQRLTELKFIRISRFDSERADNEIKAIEAEIERVRYDLDHLTDYAVAYYERIREKYGKGRERRTELRSFDTIEAAKVAVTNAKLYVDRTEGFFGIGKSMKDAEFVCDCSDIDDVIVFTKDGRYIITKVSDKAFFDKNIYYIGVFKRNDERTIYNVLYRDGKNGPILMKRCAIKGITRDKEYDITKGTPRSEILYMTVNPNGEAEVLKVYFKPRPRLKKVIVDLDFSTLAIKGRQSQGNLFSRYGIHKIVMKERGTSTLGSQEIWFDDDVHRLNTEGRGYALGAFKGEDKLLVWTPRTYYITGYDLQQHFPDDTVLVERYRPERVYAVCYFDREQNYYYLKRFPIESSDKTQFFLDEEGTGDFVCRTGRAGAQLEVTYAGAQASRPAERMEVDGFVGVKSHRAKGKRVTTFEVASLHFVEPEESEEEPADPATGDDRSGDAPAGGPAVATGAAAANEVGAASGIELPEGPAAVPPQTDDVEFTIERPRGDQDDVIDVEQLNLF